jgi:hypothetical protein
MEAASTRERMSRGGVSKNTSVQPDEGATTRVVERGIFFHIDASFSSPN